MLRTRWRIVGRTTELVIAPWSDDAITRRRAPRDAVRDLKRLTARDVSWSLNARALQECARYLRQRHGFARALAAGSDLAVVCVGLERGVLVAALEEIHKLGAPRSTLDGDALEQIPLATSLLPRTWVEIELTDMEGNPRAGERYWIQLPDGTVREGALNAHGMAYFGDLDAGDCEIRWPDLDDEAAVAVSRAKSAPTPRDLTWIEIELTDMDGNPRAGERYWIKFPDGLVRVGRLDGAGRSRFVRLVPGDCEIRWPDLDEEATVPALDPTVGAPSEEVRAPRPAPAGADARRRAPPLVVAPLPQVDPAMQARVLVEAAREGVPFCEECAKASRAAGRA